MALLGWVATHTGLPSLRVDGPTTVHAGDRTLAVLPTGQHLLSDALAVPGAPTVYRAGSDSVTLERTAEVDPSAVVTDAAGRAMAGLRHFDNSVPVDWRSSVTRFNSRVARWSIQDPPATGVSVVLLTDHELEPEAWRLLKRHGQLIIAQPTPTPGVPMRIVTVDGVRRELFSPDGWIRFEISWTELLGVAGAAPVVTWGEWAALGHGWQALSALQVAQAVAGMSA